MFALGDFVVAKSKVTPSSSEGNSPEPDTSFDFGENVEAAPPSRNGTQAPPTDAPPAAPATPAPDPFDPQALRLSQDFGAAVSVKKALLTVPVRKPDKTWFVRVHPNPAYHLQTAVVELKEDREIYLVDRALWSELATEATFGPRVLFTALNRQGVLFLWQIRLPAADGRVDDWTRTALEAAARARAGWVRVVPNMSLGGYDVFEAGGQLGEPEWPSVPFKELLRVAFRDRFINTLDHPVLRRLRGEV
jgi:hypothetical protein